MSKLDHLLNDYVAFERDVITFTAELCNPWCSTCKEVCCQADYCRETLDSAFLALIRHRYPPRTALSDGQGWLTESGCSLTAGRPPVCYEFLCNRILHSRPVPLYRHAMDALSKLMTHIGRRAAGRRHLVEIMDPSDLSAIKTDAFDRRLREAREALQVAKSILAHKPASGDATARLSRVARPPAAENPGPNPAVIAYRRSYR